MPSHFRLPFLGVLALLPAAGLSLSTATLCAADLPQRNLAELSRVWQQEFAAPLLLGTTQPPAPPIAAPGSYAANAHLRNDQPHPAVARIVVPEDGATSYGSGTLIDVRDQFGLVITNWHVVRDAKGPVEVVFPGGFRSKARPLKVDADWDLAALVVWRPPVEPVRLAASAPRTGDQLTICGYGQGTYRAATGHCTQYYAPKQDFPLHMVELDVEARQGDSGGPIFNDRGELAGVLFGAGQGTTLGSFGGRVESFLATLAPDIGKTSDESLVSYPKPGGDRGVVCRDGMCYPADGLEASPVTADDADWQAPEPELAGMWAASGGPQRRAVLAAPATTQAAPDSADQWHATAQPRWFDQAKSILAGLGLLTLGVLVLKAVC